jgi:hypothetical protein
MPESYPLHSALSSLNAPPNVSRAHLTFVEPAFSPGTENRIIIIKTTPRGKKIPT